MPSRRAATPVPNPGSDAALDLGCKCPVLDNGHGRRPDPAFGGWVINADCTVHNPPRQETQEQSRG